MPSRLLISSILRLYIPDDGFAARACVRQARNDLTMAAEFPVSLVVSILSRYTVSVTNAEIDDDTDVDRRGGPPGVPELDGARSRRCSATATSADGGSLAPAPCLAVG